MTPNRPAFVACMVAYMAVDVLANVRLKAWLTSGSRAAFAQGMFLYVGCGALWALSLKFESFAKAALFYTLIALMCGLLIGVVLFHERLSLVNWIGVGVALVAVVLVEWPS